MGRQTSQYCIPFIWSVPLFMWSTSLFIWSTLDFLYAQLDFLYGQPDFNMVNYTIDFLYAQLDLLYAQLMYCGRRQAALQQRWLLVHPGKEMNIGCFYFLTISSYYCRE